jgi:8-oxo-dGTP pyrophosphatase MutT (NUDIX family)
MIRELKYQKNANLKRAILPENRCDLAEPLRQFNPLDPCVSLLTQIVHVHILTNDVKVAVFQRSRGCGRWSCVFGEVEVGESWEDAAIREVREETKLLIKYMKLTKHFFIGVSPNGKPITGRTCFAIVSCGYLKSSGMIFDGQLKSALILPHPDALLLMETKSFPQVLEGYKYTLKHHLFKKTENTNHSSRDGKTNDELHWVFSKIRCLGFSFLSSCIHERFPKLLSERYQARQNTIKLQLPAAALLHWPINDVKRIPQRMEIIGGHNA